MEFPFALNHKALNGLSFNQKEIETSLKRGGLLSLELEFSKQCNLRCIYCYASAGKKLENELNLSEIKDIIDQAADLGAKKIILLGGGEPLMYKELPQVVEYIFNKGLQQTIFTNGILLNHALSIFLFKHAVSVVVKCNSNTPHIQDKMANVEKAYEKIKSGFDSLLEVGYPDKKCELGIQTIICRENIHELSDMWRWARESGIVPYFEIMTYQGRAKEYPDLKVSIDEVKRVFEKLKKIDEQMFGFSWNPHPTIAAFTCKRHLYSCLVNSQGNVQPCTGIDKSIGNIREKKLKKILLESQMIKNLRNIFDNIEGDCANCKFSSNCYGCRGNAFQTTGSYLSSDPFCWVNHVKK